MLLSLSLGFTLMLLGVFSFYPAESMWGFNHLHFLSGAAAVLFGIVILLWGYLTIAPLPDKSLEALVGGIDRWLWGGTIWSRLLLVEIAVALFYIFRVNVHLLGDSYTCLAVFVQGEAYIHKFAEPGSIYLVRLIQSTLGGYTRETTLWTFQILSIASGAVFVYNAISIIGRLCRTPLMRLLGLFSLLLSGAVLLFFGYVEFYPIAWAASSVFINLSLASIEKPRLLWLAVAAFVVAALMHLQTIYFLPGLVYLVVQSIKWPSVRKAGYALFGLGAAAGIALFVWLYRTRVEFEILILPPLSGRPIAPDYTVFSALHLLDLTNITLLVLPGALFVLLLWILCGRKDFRDPTALLLLFLSLGSLSFLCLFGAAITMGRDWDVMSLSFFAPLLLALYQVERRGRTLPVRVLLNYIVVAGFATLSFLAVATRTEPTEKRYYTLLNERSRNGWVIYANHFLLKRDLDRYKELMQEIIDRFPDYQQLQQAYLFLEDGDYDTAMELARPLAEKDPYQADFLSLAGNLYGKLGQYDKAEEYYLRALKFRPYLSTLMNELGQLYMDQGKHQNATRILREAHSLSPDKTFITESLALSFIYQQQFDSALAYADTLFAADRNSPGAHLINVTVALNLGDRQTATQHLKEYMKYGRDRSDYERIKEFYGYLLEGNN